MLPLGFSSGLPFLLVFSTLSAWLREAGISRTEIGMLSWVALAYSLKFLWAPIVDRYDVPVLARLRDFGGELTPDVVPAQVQVQVFNGTEQLGVAEQMSYALATAGFQVGPFGDTYPTTTTQILYAPGAGAVRIAGRCAAARCRR